MQHAIIAGIIVIIIGVAFILSFKEDLEEIIPEEPANIELDEFEEALREEQ